MTIRTLVAATYIVKPRINVASQGTSFGEAMALGGPRPAPQPPTPYPCPS